MSSNTLCVLAVAAFCFTAASSYVIISSEGAPRPLLGTRDKVCTWGPSYWCTNITTAKGCGAVRHCIQTVWEHQVLPEDNDDICKLCKNMVQQARDQLESNETQEELKEVFEGSCNLIPIKPVAEGCDKLVDEFIPELVETLASQMNPQMVCSVAGLCNNAEIDKMLAAAGKLPSVPLRKTDSSITAIRPKQEMSQCDGCSHVLDKMGKKFMATDRDEMLNNFIEACGRLGSFSDGCSAVVITHFGDLYGAIENQFKSAESCELVQMCTGSEKEKNTGVSVEIVNESSVGFVPVGDDMTCQFCVKMIDHLHDILVANTTEDEFEQVMQGLCKQTGKFKDECLSIVNTYYGLMYNFLVNHLDAKELCSLVELCPEPGKTKAPIWPLLPAHLSVNEKLIGTDEAESFKNHDVKVSVSSDSASVSVNPATMQLPIERMFPQMLRNVGANKETCAFCEYFLHYVQTKLSDKRTEEEVKNVVEKACAHLPKTINAQCQDFVDQYGQAFIAILVQEIDPSVVCPGMGLCPSKEMSEIVLVGDDKSGDKPGCPLCLLAVQQLASMVKNNKTEDNIRSALESLCAHLSTSLKQECDMFVDAYSKQLVEMLIADLTPQEVCVYIKLCNPTKASHIEALASGDISTNEVPQYENTKQKYPMKDEPKCVICEFVMTRLESMLKNNATEEEVKTAVHDICKYLPKTVEDQCFKFVDQYADLIIQILLQTLDPKSVCVSLDLCKPDALSDNDRVSLKVLQHHTRKSVEECALCEGVVQALDTYLQDPDVEHKIDELLERACQVLPAKQYSACRNFIKAYGPSIQNIIFKMPGATHLICGEIGVCLKATGQLDLLGGRKCTWGPSYWCQSEEHANACGPGTVHHCQERVWKSSRPQPAQ